MAVSGKMMAALARLKGNAMRRLLMGCLVVLSLFGAAYADDDYEPMSGYAPSDSVTITYRNKVTETLYCDTTGTHYRNLSNFVDENIVACADAQTDNPLFTKAQWIIVDSYMDSYDRKRTFIGKYYGKNCAVTRYGKHYNAWVCKSWQKLKDVGEIESGRKQEFPDDGITWYQAKTPGK